MPNLPDLSELSHGQKDELIRMLRPLQQQVQDLMAQMTVMQERIRLLEGRLALNSRNSSKPPSSDGLNKPAPKSLRVAGQRPTGGQKGHPGSTLRQASQPDRIVVHGVPDECQACQTKLPFAYVGETRQVFDLPSLQFEVTEHHAMQAICTCGQVHTGEFPVGVNASVQYGPRAQAAMVHLNQDGAWFNISTNNAAGVEETRRRCLSMKKADVDLLLYSIGNQTPYRWSKMQNQNGLFNVGDPSKPESGVLLWKADAVLIDIPESAARGYDFKKGDLLMQLTKRINATTIAPVWPMVLRPVTD